MYEEEMFSERMNGDTQMVPLIHRHLHVNILKHKIVAAAEGDHLLLEVRRCHQLKSIHTYYRACTYNTVMFCCA